MVPDAAGRIDERLNHHEMNRTVVGFSGSVATSAAIPWLAEQCGTEVVTVTLDVGQGDELAAVRERALALGAVRAHVVDAREELVRDYLVPALQAGALGEGYALVYPLIAKRLVDLARMESASAVAHGAVAGSLAATLIEGAVKAMDPALEVIAPATLWHLSEGEAAALGRKYGVHVPPAQHVRVEASVWGRRLDSTADDPLIPDAFTLTRAPEECPDDPAILDIEIVAGLPVAANGVEMTMMELIESVETIAGAHGVGRQTIGGAVLEMPAACALSIAHDALERRALGDDLAALKKQLSAIYLEALRSGRWFSDIREAIGAFVRVVQPRVTGSVKLQLSKGQCSVVDCATGNGVEASRPTAHSQAVA